MKDNRKGSALLWAIVVTMVLSITIAGALTISYSYYNRSVQNNSKRQAYLNSKNIIEDIVTNLSRNDPEYLALLDGLNEGMSTSLSLVFPADSGVGTAEGSIQMLPKEDTRGKITIRIKAVYGGQEYTTYADMQLGKKDTLITWQLVRYYRKDSHDELNGNQEKGNRLYQDIVNVVEAFNNPQEGMSPANSLLQVLKSDEEAWKRFTDVNGSIASSLNSLDNTKISFYYASRNDNGEFEKFDTTEIQDDTIRNALKGEYYIQPYFVSSSYKVGIVYAANNAKPMGTNGEDFNAEVHLIYHNSNWYYIDKVLKSEFINSDTISTKPEALKMTDFNDKTTGIDNSATAIWNRFVAKYLVEENIVR